MSAPLLEVAGLKKHFPIRGGVFGRTVGAVRAVDGVSFALQRGRTLGLVGESGSGKTTIGRLVLGLQAPTAGTIRFDGQEIARDGKLLPPRELRALRPRMQLVFQDPHGSLNPQRRVGEAIGEALVAHGRVSKRQMREAVIAVMEICGLSPAQYDRYPYEFSGGQRQRIGIARALALKPELIVADEPVSALDVSIQAQIVNLFSELREGQGVTFLFISHDLAVVEHLCDEIAVLYLGVIVETASRDALFDAPRHPYTQALIAAIPGLDPDARRQRRALTGEIPNPAAPPSGCRFHTRCPLAVEHCRQVAPALRDLGDGHRVACHLA